MIDILRDPLWQFIGALLALLTVFLTIYIFAKDRTKKELTYQISSFFPLFTLREEEQGDFTILYKGNEIQDLFVINIEITNSGNIPITSSDYEKPISFMFGKSAKIYSAEIVKTEPRALSTSLSTEGNKVVVSPVLLNGGDSIEMKFLVTSPNSEEIPADGRIVGVKEITEKRTNPYHYVGWGVISLIVLLITLFYALFSLKPAFTPERIQSNWVLYLLASIGIAIGVFGFVNDLRRRGIRQFLHFLWQSLLSVFSKE